MLTYVTTYYENPTMLRLQYLNWSHWPVELRDASRVIVVDDASPKWPAHEVQRPGGMPMVQIYRAKVDTPWHQDAARNLGCHHAGKGWMVITDIDHMLEPGAAAKLLILLRNKKLKAGRAYMPGRVEVETRLPTIDPRSGQMKPHPNSYVITRESYWAAGGFDERYCGIYGTDGKFKFDLRMLAKVSIHQLPQVALTRYSRKFVPDASCNLDREGFKDRRGRKIELDKTPQKRTTLNFEWERMV